MHFYFLIFLHKLKPMNLEKKSEYINGLTYDILAEYLVSTLVDEGTNPNNILAVFQGHLKRNWSRDIDYSEINKFDIGKETLSIHLNRTGIYDSLPEALFHTIAAEKSSTGEEMAKESVKLKIEEKNARLFFRPFENEIFLQKVQSASKETLLYKSLHADFLNSLVPDFWKIDTRVPEKYATKLIKLLPYVHEIVGNLELTAQSLEYILKEKIRIEIRHDEPKEQKLKEELSGFCLGENSLGQNLVLGNETVGFIGRLIFHIGPLENHSPAYFFENSPGNYLLKCFTGYFTPMELDVESKLILNEEQSHFLLSQDTETEIPFLGYNTVL